MAAALFGRQGAICAQASLLNADRSSYGGAYGIAARSGRGAGITVAAVFLALVERRVGSHQRGLEVSVAQGVPDGEREGEVLAALYAALTCTHALWLFVVLYHIMHVV